MKRPIALLLLLLPNAACLGEAAPVPVQHYNEWLRSELPAPDHAADYVKGVALGLHLRSDGRHYESYLWEIRQTGATHVSLVVQWSIPDIRATTVSSSTEHTAPDEDLRQVIRTAHALGLEVSLFPILWVEQRAPGEWRGGLRPTDVEAFFASYRTFILHYARIAADEEVALFSIGSELSSLEVFTTQWRSVAGDVRAAAPGALLTYSANWDHFDHVRFWDALDYVGVTGYYELSTTDERDPEVEALVAAWDPELDRLEETARRYERPVLLTEVGYFSQIGTSYHPWDYTRREPVALSSQWEAYVALYLALQARPDVGGVFVWNWFGDGGAMDNGYTPRNKPAEQLLRWWFGANEVQ